MVTSVERTVAALTGKCHDRPPYTLTLSLYGARLIDCHPAIYYREPDSYIGGQRAVMELCSPDVLFTPFSLPLEAEMFGSELIFFRNAPPTVHKYCASSIEEFLRKKLPDTKSHPNWLYFEKVVSSLASEYKNAVPICAILAAPVDLPAILLGLERWMDALICDSRAVKDILETTCRHFTGFANDLLSHGASFIAVPMVFSNPSFLFKKQIDEVVLPILSHAFSQIKGPIVVHHGGSPINGLLSSYLTLPNVAAFALDSRDSISQARDIVGPGRLLMGNLSGLSLAKAKEEDILGEVDAILEDRKDDPSFLFATSHADVPWDTRPDLIRLIAQRIRREPCP